ncbi:hypothetical protein FRC11_003632, partial [Ceratobasidium sp. 423]
MAIDLEAVVGELGRECLVWLRLLGLGYMAAGLNTEGKTGHTWEQGNIKSIE